MHPGIRVLALCTLLPAFRALSAEAADQVPGYGFATDVFLSNFIGGQSGPETPLSDTSYHDTFGTGFGFRLQGYRTIGPDWRGQVGVIHARWRGKHFVGGEFPSGVEFGDFSLAGAYVGGRLALDRGSGFVPYVVGNLGLVHLSSLSARSGGAAIPYWSGTWRDYLELGAGAAWKTGGKGALTLDLRLQVFGKPKSINFPIAEATGGQSLLLGIGYEWGLR